jgi:pimeloyl-ACP methyl ester carboxylesterase
MQIRRRILGTPDPKHFWSGSDGVRIAGDAWGNPDGQLVLMLHGVGQTRHAWRGTGKMLGDAGYHAVALDARGHGDSDWAPNGDYSRDAMIRDLQRVVAALGNHPPVLIGASMGGITSLLAVGERRLDARALILVDIAIQVEAYGVARVNDFMTRHADGFASLDQVADAIERYRPRPNRSTNLNGLAKNVRVGADGRFYWHWDPKISERASESPNRRAKAAQHVAIPTMLVRGEHSDVLSEEGVRHFQQLCPHSEFVHVANAGHMVAGDQNDAFGLATDVFLRRVAPIMPPN